jgi:hypothetical protein
VRLRVLVALQSARLISMLSIDMTCLLISPDVHESYSPDEGAVAVVDEADDLLLGQFKAPQFEEEAVGGGHDATGANAADAAAHASLVGGVLQEK